LSEERDLLAGRLQRVQAAVAAGNLTLASASPYVLAQQTAQTQVDDEARRLLGQRHQLNALLGLAPEIAVPLADSVDLPPLDIADIQAELPGLAQRRPDLVALQLGYHAQDARLRVAILSQFPNLLFGVFGGSDNANVRNAGPQVNMDLPVFDRNQGGGAVEQATRAMLHEEYAARLTAAHGQVRAILVERAQTTRQLERSRAELPAAQTAAGKAAAAAAAGNLDQRAEVDLLSAAAGKAQQIVTLEQALEDEQVALATLVGAGLPAVQLPPEEARK
jgi:outer membrane protein TolC